VPLLFHVAVARFGVQPHGREPVATMSESVAAAREPGLLEKPAVSRCTQKSAGERNRRKTWWRRRCGRRRWSWRRYGAGQVPESAQVREPAEVPESAQAPVLDQASALEAGAGAGATGGASDAPESGSALPPQAASVRWPLREQIGLVMCCVSSRSRRRVRGHAWTQASTPRSPIGSPLKGGLSKKTC